MKINEEVPDPCFNGPKNSPTHTLCSTFPPPQPSSNCPLDRHAQAPRIRRKSSSTQSSICRCLRCSKGACQRRVQQLRLLLLLQFVQFSFSSGIPPKPSPHLFAMSVFEHKSQRRSERTPRKKMSKLSSIKTHNGTYCSCSIKRNFD